MVAGYLGPRVWSVAGTVHLGGPHLRSRVGGSVVTLIAGDILVWHSTRHEALNSDCGSSTEAVPKS
jgi:hypothetical protein